MPRRSKREMRIGRALAIGQEWAKQGEVALWRVRQVHRIDCTVELEHTLLTKGNGRPLMEIISFGDLAKKWEPRDYTLLETA